MGCEGFSGRFDDGDGWVKHFLMGFSRGMISFSSQCFAINRGVGKISYCVFEMQVYNDIIVRFWDVDVFKVLRLRGVF